MTMWLPNGERRFSLIDERTNNNNNIMEEGGSLNRQKRNARRRQHTPSSSLWSFHVTSPQRQTDEASISRPTKRLRHRGAAKVHKSTSDDTPIDLLSNHTLANILLYICPTPKQLANISSVCKRFKMVAETLTTSLDLRKVDISLLNQVINRYTNVCHLDFSNVRDFDDSNMQMLLPVREKLQSLKLRGTDLSSVKSFFDQSTMKRNMPLHTIDLSWTSISYESAVAIANCCPDLKSLKLSKCQGISDAFMDCVSSTLPKLQVLDVSMCPITATGCRSLFSSTSLREVNISACPELHAQDIRTLVTGEIMEYNENDASDNADTLNKAEFLMRRGSVSHLISISAQFMTGIDAGLLDVLAVHAPHLRRLDLRHYRAINTADTPTFKMSLRKLQRKGVQVALSRRIESQL